MRILAPLLFSAAMGFLVTGSAAADASTCPGNRDCRPKPATEPSTAYERGIVRREHAPQAWRQIGIAVNPWIVPSFK